MKATTGIYDSALGAKSNETSGVAIGRRQLESDTAQYHFIDNVKRSLEYAGRVLVEIIPKIYDNERVIRLQGEDDSEEFVTINKVIMSEYGMPISIMSAPACANVSIKMSVSCKFGKPAVK